MAKRKKKKPAGGSGDPAKMVGISPGSLVVMAEKKVEHITIDFVRYTATEVETLRLSNFSEVHAHFHKPGIKWINVTGIHEAHIVEDAGKFFSLDKLTLEDILITDQRPKLDNHDKYIFAEMKQIQHDKEADQFVYDQVSIVLGSDYVLTFLERPCQIYELVHKRISNSNGKHRKFGTDYLMYSIMDTVVDNYFAVIEKMGDRIELMEDSVIADPGPDIIGKVHGFRREVIDLRRSVYPLREIVSEMERVDSELVGADLRWYLRDLYDHTIQVIEAIETYRDSASGLIDLYMSSVSNRMNSVMKVLTIIATIFIPLTFIVGVYGMNLKMPEDDLEWFYPAIWGVMIAIAGGMLFLFHRKKWL